MIAENAKVTVTVQGHEFRVTRKEARLLIGQIASSLRQTFAAGPGAPKDLKGPRCACGAMTLKRATRRYHVCPVGEGGKEEKQGKAEKGKRGKSVTQTPIVAVREKRKKQTPVV